MIQAKYNKAFSELINDLQRRKAFESSAMLDKAFALMVEQNEGKQTEADQDQVLAIIDAGRIAVQEIGLGRASISALFLYHSLSGSNATIEDKEGLFNETVMTIAEGLSKVSRIDEKAVSSQAENFRLLLLSLANDVRVILIRLSEVLGTMRQMKSMPEDEQYRLASEASFLYAPLAHRLGLYLMKSEMEDLALKYSDRETYDMIAKKLDETMANRKSFIEKFISPIKKELDKQGFNFEIKGRPKSIHSIWNKMRKNRSQFEDIYDLFAIRIILKSRAENEKADCWQVYSAVTDLFQPNPLRLRDWISVPKTNGYESLHTTVIGPEGKWVEVQIRTERMNEIAEKGVAAHWKYKGGQDQEKVDSWLGQIREILESPESDAGDFIDDFKLSLYSKEIFVFTPKGDLRKFPAGATVLDFAYDIHTDVGSACNGAKVNGKPVPIRYQLKNGDKVEVSTSKAQKPKLDWLNFATTTRALKKIRQKLNEEQVKEAENGKEIIRRRFKNWKLELTDEIIRNLLKKYKLPNAQEFYCLISTGKIEVGEIKDFVTQKQDGEELSAIEELESNLRPSAAGKKSDDFLIIDEQVANVDYKLAPCCNPIMGDSIFGFVTINDGIKIHRTNCPNARDMVGRYGYRIVKAKWSRVGKESNFPVDIFITGEDQTGILNSISDLIAKDMKISVQSISLDSDDGVFSGRVSLNVKDIEHLDELIAKLASVKGIYSVRRMDQKG